MESTLQFLLALATIIAAAKAAGYLSSCLRQPAVLGELIVGLLLGPTLLDMLHWPIFTSQGGHLGEIVYNIAQLGVLFLMFMAGLEVDVQSMRVAGRAALLAGVLGVLAPIVLGMLAVMPFGFSPEQMIFIGLMLSATSVSISAQTLMELDVLRSRVGITLLGGAVVDDVLVILCLSVFTALVDGSGGGPWGIVWVVLRMVLFVAAAIWFGLRYLPRLSHLVDYLPISEGLMALAVVVTLVYAWAAEALGGMAAITGAFLAGLLFGRTTFRQHLESGVHLLTYAFLAPVFFVSIGLEADIKAVGASGLTLSLLIIVVAIVSKVVGCGAGGLLGGLGSKDALRLGIGMISRGEVGLIVANIGLNAGLIGEDVFASVVLMVLVTTLLTPVLLRLVYPRAESKAQAQADAV